MAKTVTIIDTFGFFFRSFYALPPLSNQNGFPTGLLTGFTNFIATLQKDHSSDYLIFALDTKGPTFRNEIDPNYKANRQAPPEELTMQLPIAIEWIEKMGYKTLSQVGFEADDMIASAAATAVKQGLNVRIVSHDKDLYQMIDDGKIVLVDAIKRKEIDSTYCLDKYGIRPDQFTDYQALIGDSADNVPGVKGVGKVTAQKLLSEFDTLKNVYASLDEIKPAGVQKKLREKEDDAWMSHQLVTLKNDIFEDDFNFEDYVMHDDNPFLNIYDDLVEYEMNAVLRVIHAKGLVSQHRQESVKEEVKSLQLDFETELITDEKRLNEVLSTFDSSTLIAFDTETTGLSYHDDTMVGFSFATTDKKAYYVPFAHFYLGVPEQVSSNGVKIALKKIFESKVIGHNIKFDLHFVQKFLNQSNMEIYADTMILGWLVNPESALSLDKLSLALFQHTMVSFKDTVKKGETFASVDIEDAAKYAAEDALVTFKLYEKLTEMLSLQDASHLIDEATNVEFPFVMTLTKMEEEGIELNQEFMSTFKEEVRILLDELTQNIYKHAGSEFNINSTKQLGVVLFETLELPVIKKTKTGYSTDEKVLHTLEHEHEIIGYLLKYREMHKLYSTYIDPLLKLAQADEKSRIYTSFVQTGTATGRLSSKNPNLQNIPVRSTMGAKIREAFVASEGKKLIGIDYSQIELRLLAHFSQDSVLVNAFKEDKDIHMQTAIALFGEEDAASKRSVAKTVNFGLLYGMGPKKLSDTLGISTKEAKEIIEKYFESFPTVKNYFRSIVDNAKEDGYVQTLLNRRRYFDFEKASGMLKAAYERESVNTVFQGSAADLIKLSMNKIMKVIQDENLNVKVLLQIHDELIFEVNASEAEVLGSKFETIMENIFELNIPLKASCNIGNNWGELK